MSIVLYKNYSYEPIELNKHNIPTPNTANTLYFVATSSLEQHRRVEKQRLLFLLAMQKILRTRMQYRFWSRTEEATFLIRASKMAQSRDYTVSIQKDWQKWHKLLSRFAETPDVHHSKITQQLETPNLADIGQKLYKDWLQQLAIGQRDKRKQNPHLAPNATWYTFEEAFQDAMENRASSFFDGVDHVVMEGFTYLPPLHQYFLEVASKYCNVHLILPWSDTQSRGFETLERLIQDISIDEIKNCGTPSTHFPPLLQYAKTQLFVDANKTVSFQGQLDDSLQVHTHINRQDEIQQVITHIKSLLNPTNGQPAVRSEQIVIVTRSAKEFEEQLLLEAQYQGIEEHFTIDNSNILLTPVGKLLLTLYGSVHEVLNESTEVEFHEEVRFSADDIQTIFRSGIFGDKLRQSLRSFYSLKAKFLETLETKQDWLQALEQIKKQIPASPKRIVERDARTPENFVTTDEIILWQEKIQTIFEKMEAMRKEGPMNVRGHIEKIHTLLKTIGTSDSSIVVDKIMKAIQETFEVVLQQKQTSERSIPYRIPEIHQFLVGFGNQVDIDMERELNPDLSEAESAENNPAQENAEQEKKLPDSGYIKILGLEGIDNTTKDYIFWIGVDEKHHPKFQDVWPFVEEKEKQVQLERYLFLSVIRSANIQLSIHWSKADQREPVNPSIYLLELAAICGLKLKLRTMSNTNPNYPKDPPQPFQLTSVGNVKSFSLTELSIFSYCPRRWLLEELDNRNAAFEHTFHNRWMLQIEWIESAIEKSATGTRLRWSEFKRNLRKCVQEDSLNFLSIGSSTKLVSNAIVKLMFAMTRDIERIPVDWEEKPEPEVALSKVTDKVENVHGYAVEIECGYELTVWTNGNPAPQRYPLTFPIVMRTWLSRVYGYENGEQILTGMTRHIDWIHSAHKTLGAMAFHAEVYDAILRLQDSNQTFPPKEEKDSSCHLCPVRSTCFSMNGGQ